MRFMTSLLIVSLLGYWLNFSSNTMAVIFFVWGVLLIISAQVEKD